MRRLVCVPVLVLLSAAPAFAQAKATVQNVKDIAYTSVPNFLIHEFYPDNYGFNPKGFTSMTWELDKEGYIGLPPGPGLGVEVNEKFLEEESKKPQTYRWPGSKLRDGSVADY